MTVNVELDETEKHIVISAEWRFKELCKSIPGAKWDVKKQIWTVPKSWATCLALRSTFQDSLKIGEKLSFWAAQERAQRIEPAVALQIGRAHV